MLKKRDRLNKLNSMKRLLILLMAVIISCSAMLFSSSGMPDNQEAVAARSVPASESVLSSESVLASEIDLTAQIEVLGQPFSLPEYARNIWDMQVFEGRVYLGCGNYYNDGPAPNAGPVPVICYDTGSGTFITQATLEEEQIDIFRILDGKLVIPGIDPREDWSFGNYYTLENDVWVKTRTIPDGAHNFDLAYFKGNLYAATGTVGFGSAVKSADGGQTWQSLIQRDSKGSFFLKRYFTRNRSYTQDRSYSIFTYKGKLYFTGILFAGLTSSNQFLCVDDEISTVSAYNMLPGAFGRSQMRMHRINEIGDRLLYIAIYNIGSEWLPDALYTAVDINKSKRIRLPEPDALPMDILPRENKTYLLAYVKQGRDEYTNIVYSSEDMVRWRECFRFTADTFARSFEKIDDTFYFGLGCYTDHLSESAGKILRINGAKR